VLTEISSNRLYYFSGETNLNLPPRKQRPATRGARAAGATRRTSQRQVATEHVRPALNGVFITVEWLAPGDDVSHVCVRDGGRAATDAAAAYQRVGRGHARGAIYRKPVATVPLTLDR
jgi:hypothetical protein